MDDYIFLIIAIGLSIFGAINQNKKKKALDDPFSEKAAKPKNFFLDQLLGEDFLAEPVAEIKPMVMRPALKKEPLVSPKPAERSGLYHGTFSSTLDRSKKPLQPSLRKPMNEVVETENETEDTPDYLEDFSLRKAFVYSEILQRKY